MVNITHVVAAAGVTLLGAVAGGAAQPPREKVLTTSSGVYTARQASRGEQTYMNICVSCHPSGTYTSPVFRAKWNGSPVSELFGLISQTMPKQEPATLSPEEYADVVAYLLKINGAPPGKTELPAEPRPLRGIRIAMPAGTVKGLVK